MCLQLDCLAPTKLFLPCFLLELSLALLQFGEWTGLDWLTDWKWDRIRKRKISGERRWRRGAPFMITHLKRSKWSVRALFTPGPGPTPRKHTPWGPGGLILHHPISSKVFFLPLFYLTYPVELIGARNFLCRMNSNHFDRKTLSIWLW